MNLATEWNRCTWQPSVRPSTSALARTPEFEDAQHWHPDATASGPVSVDARAGGPSSEGFCKRNNPFKWMQPRNVVDCYIVQTLK